jgi:hypothetical protein
MKIFMGKCKTGHLFLPKRIQIYGDVLKPSFRFKSSLANVPRFNEIQALSIGHFLGENKMQMSEGGFSVKKQKQTLQRRPPKTIHFGFFIGDSVRMCGLSPFQCAQPTGCSLQRTLHSPGTQRRSTQKNDEIFLSRTKPRTLAWAGSQVGGR